MGTIRNEMTIVHYWRLEEIKELREDALKVFPEDMVSQIMESHVNSEYTFVINGECSKNGWEDQKKYRDLRLKWCERHKHDAAYIVVVNLGEGDAPAYIVFDNTGNKDFIREVVKNG